MTNAEGDTRRGTFELLLLMLVNETYATFVLPVHWAGTWPIFNQTMAGHVMSGHCVQLRRQARHTTSQPVKSVTCDSDSPFLWT